MPSTGSRGWHGAGSLRDIGRHSQAQELGEGQANSEGWDSHCIPVALPDTPGWKNNEEFSFWIKIFKIHLIWKALVNVPALCKAQGSLSISAFTPHQPCGKPLPEAALKSQLY